MEEKSFQITAHINEKENGKDGNGNKGIHTKEFISLKYKSLIEVA